MATNPRVQAATSRLSSASPASKVLLAGSVFFVDNEFRAYGSWLGLVAAAIVAVGGLMALGEANAAAARGRRSDRAAQA